MPADRAEALTAAPAAEAPAAPAFVMVGTDDAGLCVDGVCAVPAPPADGAAPNPAS